MATARRTSGRTDQGVEPALGWTYLSREALARAKAQMDEESMGVRDEVGFLTVHQRYADRFFPGTSVLHTRARYTLFVPWLFQDLAGLTGAPAQRALQERERLLAGRLRNRPGEDQPDRRGTIGSLKFPKPSAQPPSVVYWNALASWGILRPSADGRAISRSQVHRLLGANLASTDDDGQPLFASEPPFVQMPDRPANWLDGEITLRMRRVEADFLRDRLIHLRRPNSPELSLLARLARTEALPPDSLWDKEARAIAGDDAQPLRRARGAASLAAIGRAIYDALLETMVEREDKKEPSTRHRQHLATLVDTEGRRAASLDLAGLEADIGRLPEALRNVVSATRAWISAGASNPADLRDVYVAAEARKGPRARLAMTPNGRSRRLEWASDAHGLAGPLHYRWDQVWTLLNDLVAVDG